MWLMRDNKVVAKPFKQNGIYWGLRREPGLTAMDTPLSLFGWDKTEVTMEQFYTWVKKRCCPPTRVDIADVLASLGLDRYDPLAIVQKTNALLPMKDDFWVDFDKW